MSDVPNPWLPENWNLTAQGAYIREYGLEVAKGKAKKAGTKIGAPAPRLIPENKTIVIVQRRNIGGGGGIVGAGSSGDGPPS